MFTSPSYYLSIWSINQTHGNNLSPILLLSSWIYFKEYALQYRQFWLTRNIMIWNYMTVYLNLVVDVIECFDLEGTLKVIQFQLPCHGQGTIFSTAGCSKPHPTWPWTLPGLSVETRESAPQNMFMNISHIVQALVQSSHIFRKFSFRTQIYKKLNIISVIGHFSLLIMFF